MWWSVLCPSARGGYGIGELVTLFETQVSLFGFLRDGRSCSWRIRLTKEARAPLRGWCCSFLGEWFSRRCRHRYCDGGCGATLVALRGVGPTRNRRRNDVTGTVTSWFCQAFCLEWERREEKRGEERRKGECLFLWCRQMVFLMIRMMTGMSRLAHVLSVCTTGFQRGRITRDGT